MFLAGNSVLSIWIWPGNYVGIASTDYAKASTCGPNSAVGVAHQPAQNSMVELNGPRACGQ